MPRAARVKSRGKTPASAKKNARRELVIISGMSGAGKASVLKAFEDLGYYAVDNLPIELIPSFADMAIRSSEIEKTAMVVDVREGQALEKFPAILKQVKRALKTQVVFLDANDEALIRRFSETRRPHPMGRDASVKAALKQERKRLDPIRNLADVVIDTSKFNVHELRAHINEKFHGEATGRSLMIAITSFGFKNGVPSDADLVFDVRFLPNPHFIPEFRPYTGKHPKVAAYIRSFPQTQEFIQRATQLLLFLLPHYIREGKSYLTIAIGCTGGQHRSVMIAEELRKNLTKAGYKVKSSHRDSR